MRTTILTTTGLLMVLLSTGCTIVFTVAGARADARNARSDIHTWDQPRRIPEGSPVTVTLADSTQIQANYTGTHLLSEEEYARLYNRFREERDLADSLPDLQQILNVSRRAGTPFRGNCEGFRPQSLYVLRTAGFPANPQHATVTSLTDAAGFCFSLSGIPQLLESRELPVRDAIEIEQDNFRRVLPLHEIRDIHAAPRKTHYWLLGLGLGLCGDALITYVLLHGGGGPGPYGPLEMGSWY